MAKQTPARATEAPKMGRPATGKRSNPEYRKVSAIIRKDTHDEVMKRLFLDGRKEFSDLVQTLLQQWLERRKSK